MPKTCPEKLMGPGVNGQQIGAFILPGQENELKQHLELVLKYFEVNNGARIKAWGRNKKSPKWNGEKRVRK